MLDECFYEYINYFPDKTIFITIEKCINNKTNYSDYTIFTFSEGLEYIPNKLILGSHFKVKIGKDIDNNMKIFFYIILGISLLISIFLCFTKKRVLRNID